MVNEARSVYEEHVAFNTWIRTLSSVSANVALQFVPLNECSWTQVALKWALACVYANVLCHVCLVVDHIAALSAVMESAFYEHE